MFIVADKKRKEEYERKIHYQAFKPLLENDRIHFLDYETLHKIYNQTIESKKISACIWSNINKIEDLTIVVKILLLNN